MNAAVNTVSSFYAERLKLIFRKYILMVHKICKMQYYN